MCVWTGRECLAINTATVFAKSNYRILNTPRILYRHKNLVGGGGGGGGGSAKKTVTCIVFFPSKITNHILVCIHSQVTARLHAPDVCM